MSQSKKTVKIIPVLAEKVDSILKDQGYSSRANFVEDAIRRHLEYLKSQSKHENLTEDEKLHLIAWAQDCKGLNIAEENEIQALLLENQHVWPWLINKLLLSVEFIMSLKSN